MGSDSAASATGAATGEASRAALATGAVGSADGLAKRKTEKKKVRLNRTRVFIICTNNRNCISQLCLAHLLDGHTEGLLLGKDVGNGVGLFVGRLLGVVDGLN